MEVDVQGLTLHHTSRQGQVQQWVPGYQSPQRQPMPGEGPQGWSGAPGPLLGASFMLGWCAPQPGCLVIGCQLGAQ